MLLLDVKLRFEKALGELFPHKPDITRFLLGHERKEKCVKNLCEQVVLAEQSMGGKFKTKQLDSMVTSIARLFARNALQHKEEQLLSQAQKNALTHKPSIEEVEADLVDRGIIIHEAPRNSESGRTHPGTKGTGLA